MIPLGQHAFLEKAEKMGGTGCDAVEVGDKRKEVKDQKDNAEK